jgi:hypothetical protein
VFEEARHRRPGFGGRQLALWNGDLLDTNIVTASLKSHPGVRQRIRASRTCRAPGAMECGER